MGVAIGKEFQQRIDQALLSGMVGARCRGWGKDGPLTEPFGFDGNGVMAKVVEDGVVVMICDEDGLAYPMPGLADVVVSAGGSIGFELPPADD